MEQYKNISSKSPGGIESHLCCVRCLSTRSDFSKLDLASFKDKERDVEASMNAIREASNPALSMTAGILLPQ
jgi:hypothetical protein